MKRVNITMKVPKDLFNLLDQKAAKLGKTKQEILAPIIEHAIRELEVPDDFDRNQA